MGNQLVHTVRTVIRPIDYYLADLPDYRYKCSLGQTQFLKAALCSHEEGDVVVKVLPHEDPSLLLEKYRQELLELAKKTRNSEGRSSVASASVVILRDRFACLVRQYIRYSLYDRLLTRPFLTDLEKAWIVYQILRCIGRCHRDDIYHGDLKLENILVTSSLWVVVSDFAPYKPIYLPDNPLYFNYFFDTSRRRCCNIAPERFVSSQTEDKIPLSNIEEFMSTDEEKVGSEDRSKMDMFSIGCILAEIYSDNHLFELGELLAYKANKYTGLDCIIDKMISDSMIRRLVQNLVSLDPKQRKSCQDILNELKGTFFPTYFEELYQLMIKLNRHPPDAKILYLWKYAAGYEEIILKENPHGFTILLMLVTSSMRSLRHASAKMLALQLIHRWVVAAPVITNHAIDRFIPYLVHLFGDKDSKVRGATIKIMTSILEQTVDSEESNIFNDYLIGYLMDLASKEKSVYVRMCLASCIGRLAAVAMKLLDRHDDQIYYQELKVLRKHFQDLVSTMMTDSNNCVRRSLLMTPNTCAQLCVFFGRDKSCDVLLSYLVTFLNDKKNFQMRLSFFDNLVVIASYLGVQLCILQPLFQQGFYDSEELLIAKTISCISSLVQYDLFSKRAIIDLTKEIAPLLTHPNLWISNSVLQLISVLSTCMNMIDFNLKVLPLINSFYSEPLNCFSDVMVCGRKFGEMKHKLQEPLPRDILDTIFYFRDGEVLRTMFHMLDTEESDVKKSNALYQRLTPSSLQEKQLASLGDLLIRIHRNKRNLAQNSEEDQILNVIECKSYLPSREVLLLRNNVLFKSITSESFLGTNPEWRQMFSLSQSTRGVSSKSTFDAKTETLPLGEGLECPSLLSKVREYLQHKKKSFTRFPRVTMTVIPPFRPKGVLVGDFYEHSASVNQMARFNNTELFVTCSDDGSLRLWDQCNKLSGAQSMHSSFQFHLTDESTGQPLALKGVVNCGHYIIAYTTDRQVLVFQVLESRMNMVCSFQVGTEPNSAITSLCSLNQYLFAVSMTTSVIYIFDTRYFFSPFFSVPVSKLSISPQHRFIKSIDGSAQALFVATSSGYMVCFDLRFNLPINTFTSNGHSSISKIKFTNEGLFSSAYCNYDVTQWDVRSGQIYRIFSPHSCNEITRIQSSKSPRNATKHTEVQDSDFPSERSSQVVNAILPIINDTSSGVLTAGSDFRIRYWDLKEPDLSYIVSDPAYKACVDCFRKPTAYSLSRPHSPDSSSGEIGPLASYVLVNKNGVERVEEIPNQNAMRFMQGSLVDSMGKWQENHWCAPSSQTTSAAHHDSITDLITIDDFLISSGRNGVVKIWH